VADTTTIASDALRATIAHRGAELLHLTDSWDRELMGPGDPAFWSGRAPLLFPIIGRLHDDTLRLDGAMHRMEKHGFARTSDFALVAATADSARFRLADDAASRAQYPFAFALDMAFALAGATLSMAATVRNTGDGTLPFSFGYHPAFAWPLPHGGARGEHRVVFEKDEPAPLARVTPYGTIGAVPKPSPVSGNAFTLSDALFADDALVWRDLASKRLRYGPPNGPGLDIAFPDTPMLGIWTKPGAAFVCVEPWAGHADPEGYDGDFRDKPGIMQLAPGAASSFRMSVTLTA
jgi:galactose mutarotase-like enzyme